MRAILTVKKTWVMVMKNRIESLRNRYCFLSCFGLLILFALLAGCAQQATQEQTLQSGKQDGLPMDIMGGQLQGGLSVVYFNNKFKHIDDMPKSKQAIAKFGVVGPPVGTLDHQFGKGQILDSGRSTEVGVLMNGLIHLDKPGTYLFQAMSNDGFQLYIDGNLIVSDPGVHGDRMSENGRFEVAKGGMFPVEIKYFQRKGTATLSLYWQPPGSDTFSIVPGSAISHLRQ